MKLLVVANPDGQIGKMNELIEEYHKTENVMFVICLGDMCLASSTTPTEFFLRSKFRHQADESIEANKHGYRFYRPVYMIYGSLDDPFIPMNEFRIDNLNTVWQGTNKFAAYNDSSDRMKEINIGFLSGYHNPRKFKKRNSRRLKMSRERQSLALCLEDFHKFRNSNMDILFSYESPFGFPRQSTEEESPTFGSPHILNLIERSNPKLVVYGHHRQSSINVESNKTIVGMNSMDKEIGILDLYNNTLTLKQGQNFIYDEEKIIEFSI